MFKRLKQLNPGRPLIHVVYYSFLWSLNRLVITAIFGFRVYGAGNIPRTGPIVVVANHQSFFDPPIMGAAFKRHLYYIARSSLFRNPVFSAMIESLNALAISGNQSDTAAFKLCESHLKKGRIVLIYPEGSRTGDGSMQRFHRGVLILLRRSGAPVLPLAIEGSFHNWRRSEKRPHWRGPIQVNIGELISNEELKAMSPDDALGYMHRRIESLQLDLRGKMRLETEGRFPPPCPTPEVCEDTGA